MFGTRKIQASTGAVLGGSALLLLCALLALAAGMSACSADSPSEPGQPAGTTPGTQASVWSITVTVDPPQIPAGSTDQVTVTATIRRRDNGQLAPNGTTVVFAASAGSFVSNVGQVVSGRAQVLYVAPTDQGPGSVTIQAQLEGDVGQTLLNILEPDTFYIASVQPSTGSPVGGERVTIQGGGFESPVRVTFGGVPAQVISVAASRIVVETPPSSTSVPAGSTLPVDVGVTINLNQAEQASDTLSSGFTYARGGSVVQPAVFSVTPSGGPNEGGTTVTINGEGFQSPVGVFFGSGTSPSNFTGVEATVQSVTSNKIVVTSPAASGFGQDNLNQTVSLLVRNEGNGFATVATGAFTYGTKVLITAIGPTIGPFTGGTRVTIHGQGFDEPVTVSIDGIGQSVLSVTGTEIVIRTVGVAVGTCPADGRIQASGFQVTNVDTGDSAEADVTFTYVVPVPIITSVSPSSGTENGGTLVTIGGVDFSQPSRVLFGDQAATVNNVASDGSQIQVNTPTFAGDLQEEACGDGGTRFVPTAVDLQVENLVTGCSDTFTNGFIYNPTDTSCRNQTPTEPATPQCSDGLDNDGDGLTDYNGGVSPPGDPECASDGDDNEAS